MAIELISGFYLHVCLRYPPTNPGLVPNLFILLGQVFHSYRLSLGMHDPLISWLIDGKSMFFLWWFSCWQWFFLGWHVWLEESGVSHPVVCPRVHPSIPDDDIMSTVLVPILQCPHGRRLMVCCWQRVCIRFVRCERSPRAWEMRRTEENGVNLRFK